MTENLTRKQKEVLEFLEKNSEKCNTKTVTGNQKEIAKKFGVTRQAFSNHIRVLKEKGLVRTGRGFINITEKGLNAVNGNKNREIIILAQTKAQTQFHEEDFPGTVSYLAGEFDLMIETTESKLGMAISKLKEDSLVENQKVLFRLRKG